MRYLPIILITMGLLNWTVLFGQNNKKDSTEKVDINKPIENPNLKNAFKLFVSNKTEDNLHVVINEFLKANFLVLIVNDEMITTQNKNLNLTTVEKGSVLKFVNCFDTNGNTLLPLFTDWNEVDLWLNKRDSTISSWVMPTFDAFSFALQDQSYYGVAINPGSDDWIMTKEQIKNFIDDFKK